MLETQNGRAGWLRQLPPPPLLLLLLLQLEALLLLLPPHRSGRASPARCRPAVFLYHTHEIKELNSNIFDLKLNRVK